MSRLSMNGRRVVECVLQGDSVRAVTGSMIAYEGDVEFRNAGLGGGDGLVAGLKRRATGESLKLMECRGHGRVLFAVEAQDVTVVDLADDTLMVESQQLLLVAGSVKTDVRFSGLRGASTGQGLFTTTVQGQGQVALLSAGGPLIALGVGPGTGPLVVDPDAFVAYRGRLTQSFVTDVSWTSVLGEGGGEPFSLRFEGDGVVYIQPEERAR